MAAPVLAVSQLHKRYGRQEALAGVDLEVEAGQLVGLLGPNGAGKSTLTKIACGLVRPSAGTVEVLGRRAGSPQARAALGYLAELFRFPGWLSASELLRFHQRLVGSSSRSRRGEPTSAWAIPSRCCIPFDIASTRVLAASESPTSSRSRLRSPAPPSEPAKRWWRVRSSSAVAHPGKRKSSAR